MGTLENSPNLFEALILPFPRPVCADQQTFLHHPLNLTYKPSRMKKLITSAMACCAIFLSFGQFAYPPTKTVDSSDTYFGVTYKDPYRWLENFKDSEVVDWFRQQSALSKSVLDRISGRDELIAEWKRLDKLQPPAISGRDFENGRIFYRKTMPGENVSKLYYREGMGGKEQLLFDPAGFIKGKTLSIQSALPSFDGKKNHHRIF